MQKVVRGKVVFATGQHRVTNRKQLRNAKPFLYKTSNQHRHPQGPRSEPQTRCERTRQSASLLTFFPIDLFHTTFT